MVQQYFKLDQKDLLVPEVLDQPTTSIFILMIPLLMHGMLLPISLLPAEGIQPVSQLALKDMFMEVLLQIQHRLLGFMNMDQLMLLV